MGTATGKNSTILTDDARLEAAPAVPFSGTEPDTVSSTAKPAGEPINARPKAEPATTVLREGKTLRLLAQEIFGNREFWVYIYLENKDKIPNPNRVTSGMELLLPDKNVYSIDAANPQSVARAKTLGEEILEKF